jgi:hypothetical protein
MNGQSVQLGRYTANTHSHSSGGSYSLLTVEYNGTDADNFIRLDSSVADQVQIKMVSGDGAIVDINSADCFKETLKVRQVAVCVNDETWYMLVLGSEAKRTPFV